MDAVAALQLQVDAFSARVARQERRGTNNKLAGLAPFSPNIRGSVIPAGSKLSAFTKFTRKTGPEEHISEFQSQMFFHQPDTRVYYKAFPSSLARPALKWFNRLPEGCITSFEELKIRFAMTYMGRVWQDKDEDSLMTIK
ncbi:hypothetical protein LIER_17627 [Lithospermum erythrorhizon]|uniref:Retrotransposon gag domain-containing protein n=1 Tax=Lithospermum erythrorhizon TaxID=34254 RepID=A0AAV3QB23_LITER